MKTKTLLIVGAVAVGAYLLYRQQTANANTITVSGNYNGSSFTGLLGSIIGNSQNSGAGVGSLGGSNYGSYIGSSLPDYQNLAEYYL